MTDIQLQLQQELYLNIDANANKFHKARLSANKIIFQDSEKFKHKKNRFSNFQRKSVPHLPSYKHYLQKDLLYPVLLKEKQTENTVTSLTRNLTPKFNSRLQFQNNQFKKRNSMEKTGAFPSLNSVKLDPSELPDANQKKQIKNFEILLKKPNFLQNKSEKYINQCSKLKQTNFNQNGEKLFFISNLVLNDFHQSNKLKSFESKTLIRLKQPERQKKIKNMITTKLIQKSPFELKTGKIVQQKKQIHFPSRYQYDHNLKQKFYKLKFKKQKEKQTIESLKTKNQESFDGWNQNQGFQSNVYLQNNLQIKR